MKILITGGSGFIGTNAVHYFASKNHEILNLDKDEPLDMSLKNFWKRVDIMDQGQILHLMESFQPDWVIHLAARADCDENTTVEKGYSENTIGTRHVLEAIAATPSVKRAIITSSQFVCGPEHAPQSDTDYAPATIYGQSKVITEQLTRAANLDCCWTLVRPTNIWGAWHQRYSTQFWRIASKGLYVHPGGDPVIRCYGYVGNLIYYLNAILEAEPSIVNGKTFYLSDPAADIFHWTNAFCLALRGRGAPKVPRFLLKLLGITGDGIAAITKKPFYIDSSRCRSMVTDYLVPGEIEKTIHFLGSPPFTLEDGVKATVRWLRGPQGPVDFTHKKSIKK